MNSSHCPYSYFETSFTIEMSFILSTCGQDINNIRISPQHVETLVLAGDIRAMNIPLPDLPQVLNLKNLAARTKMCISP